MTMFFAGELFQVLMSFLVALPSFLVRVALYVLSSLAIYVIARRRGLKKLWLAWVPMVNVWMLGSLSDQYQYVVRRKNTSRRKWLLALNLIKPVLLGIVAVFGVSAVFYSYWQDAAVAAGVAIPMFAVAIAGAVIRYIALYDVYRSLDPDNAVLFLVLSICFSVTEPFFLFFNRNKDLGMPPRRETCE